MFCFNVDNELMMYNTIWYDDIMQAVVYDWSLAKVAVTLYFRRQSDFVVSDSAVCCVLAKTNKELQICLPLVQTDVNRAR